jgi:hypothetical protein
MAGQAGSTVVVFAVAIGSTPVLAGAPCDNKRSNVSRPLVVNFKLMDVHVASGQKRQGNR